MFKKNIVLIILTLIIVLGLLVRVWGLTTAPNGLSVNEASIGYNAYSILKTGRDETGAFLPLKFESLGDYKLPLSIYLTVSTIGILGLNEWGVRSISIVVGCLSIVFIYLAALRFFKSKKVALVAAFLLSLSPWFIQTSRTDISVTLAIAFLLIQLIIFKSQVKYKIISLLVLEILLLLTHPATFGFSLILFVYYIFKLTNGRQRWIYLLSSFLIFLLLSFIYLKTLKFFYFQDAFFNEIGFKNQINYLRGLSNANYPFVGKLVQNRLTVFIEQIILNYIKPFDFYYLFSKSDFKETNIVYNFGKFYSIELIFFLLGFYQIVKKNNNLLFFSLLIFLAPLPGLFDLNPNFGQTFFFFIIPFYLVTAYGIVFIFEKIKSLPIKLTYIGVNLIVLILSLTTFLHYYINHYPLESAKEWGLGYKQISQLLPRYYDDYDQIVISDSISPIPYIYILFYEKVDPALYQSLNKDRGGSKFISTSKFGKYQFRSINWEADQSLKRTLLVGFNSEIPKVAGNCQKNILCWENKEDILLFDKNSKLIIIGSRL